MSINFEIITDNLVADSLLIINELLESNIILDEHSPAVALIEALAYTIKELTYYIEQIPKRSLIMAVTEASQEVFGESVKAAGVATLYLAQPLPSPWVIPSLTIYGSNGLLYISGVITVPAGFTTMNFDVVAAEAGSVYNIPAGAILGYVGAVYPQIATVTNLSSFTGGADELDLDERLALATKALHRRGSLITAGDYQHYIQGIYPGSAVLVGSVNAQGVEERGLVTSFILLPSYQNLSLQQKISLESLISQHTLLGIANNVEDLTILEVSVQVIIESFDGKNPVGLYEEIKVSLLNFIDPYTWDVTYNSVNIKQLELLVGRVEGVRLIQGVYLATDLTSLRMPTNVPIPKFALPRMVQLEVNMISYPSNNRYDFSNTFYEEQAETPEEI